MRHLFFNINIISGKWAGVAWSIRKNIYFYLKAKISTSFFLLFKFLKKAKSTMFYKNI